MRTLGWILGGIFLADGLAALIGGSKALQWMQDAVTPIVPDNWQSTMNKFTNIDATMRKTIAVNQIVAGTGMMLAAMGSMCAPREDIVVMEAPSA